MLRICVYNQFRNKILIFLKPNLSWIGLIDQRSPIAMYSRMVFKYPKVSYFNTPIHIIRKYREFVVTVLPPNPVVRSVTASWMDFLISSEYV